MQRRGEFRVSVTKDYLVFCLGALHHVRRAPLRRAARPQLPCTRDARRRTSNEESWFVFDFVELKKIMRRLCDEIDHLVLLPLKSSRVQVDRGG